MAEWSEGRGGHGDSPYLDVLDEGWVGVEKLFGSNVFE